MRGYIVQIEEATRDNQHYRRVLFTAEHLPEKNMPKKL